jgi:hypothetical protein
MPDKISHSITMSMKATPNSMNNPSCVVNFDRFIAPPWKRLLKKGQHGIVRAVLIDGEWG